MRELKNNNEGSAIPLILFVGGVLAAGGLYTFCFIVLAPSFYDLIPDGGFKTLILGIIYFVPLVILVVGVLALILAGMKDNPTWRGGQTI